MLNSVSSILPDTYRIPFAFGRSVFGIHVADDTHRITVSSCYDGRCADVGEGRMHEGKLLLAALQAPPEIDPRPFVVARELMNTFYRSGHLMECVKLARAMMCMAVNKPDDSAAMFPGVDELLPAMQRLAGAPCPVLDLTGGDRARRHMHINRDHFFTIRVRRRDIPRTIFLCEAGLTLSMVAREESQAQAPNTYLFRNGVCDPPLELMIELAAEARK